MFQAKAYPISSRFDHDSTSEIDGGPAKIERSSLVKKTEESETSADEAELEYGMTFIRRHNVENPNSSQRNSNGMKEK